MTERVSQEAQLRADKLRLLEAVGFFGESRLGRRADGRQMLREIRQIAERLPALREQLEAEVREGLAAVFERQAERCRELAEEMPEAAKTLELVAEIRDRAADRCRAETSQMEGRNERINTLTLTREGAILREIAALIDEGMKHALDDGGCGKSSDGRISLHFNTGWDRLDGEPLKVDGVSVYSYMLGPSREHFFDTPEEALAAVREWHRAEMEGDDD